MRLSAAPLNELPPVTRWLAAAFFAGWLAEMALGFKLNFYLGLVPFNLLGQFWLWQAVTYIFLHAGIWHLLLNVLMLWMLGRVLEPAMGSRRFLLYFLACGAAAALVTAAWHPGSPRPVIGASGAVYGLLGAFAFLYPDTTVQFYFIFPMSARLMAVLLGALEFVMTLAAPGSGISNITHLGGLAAGLLWLWGERRWRERAVRAEPDPAFLEQAEIDRVLEKIAAKGQGALSRKELALLDNYAKRRGGARLNKADIWKKKIAGIKGKAVIGLTGPIASGKSLALDYFKSNGAFCVSADAVAAEVLTSPACYNRISRKFSSDKILTNGLLDKKRLAAAVFGAPAKRKWLEALLHPEILRRTYSLINRSRKKIAVVEAPLLFEAGLEDCFMLTVCLAAPGKALEERARKRGWSRAEYLARAKAQLPARRKYELASLVLENSGRPAQLGERIRFLCGFLKALKKENCK